MAENTDSNILEFKVWSPDIGQTIDDATIVHIEKDSISNLNDSSEMLVEIALTWAEMIDEESMKENKTRPIFSRSFSNKETNVKIQSIDMKMIKTVSIAESFADIHFEYGKVH